MKLLAKITLSVLFLSGIPLHARDAEKISVLIVTGQNNHDWFRSTPKIEAMLNTTGRFDVTTTTTPSQQAPEDAWNDWEPKFKDYSVVLSDYNGKMWPEKVKADFLSYVSGGGRVLLVHAANNAFTGWNEYEEMCGLMWRNSDYSNRLYLDKDLKLVRLPKKKASAPATAKAIRIRSRPAMRRIRSSRACQKSGCTRTTNSTTASAARGGTCTSWHPLFRPRKAVAPVKTNSWCGGCRMGKGNASSCFPATSAKGRNTLPHSIASASRHCSSGERNGSQPTR